MLEPDFITADRITLLNCEGAGKIVVAVRSLPSFGIVVMLGLPKPIIEFDKAFGIVKSYQSAFLGREKALWRMTLEGCSNWKHFPLITKTP